ncbi:unnamed protein product [Strongylus vulgaris]|uniref:Galectin domain-containing protein n=1 Tax=Strongylus vulgaris TaxID=40348 RepID=A0A3P7IMV1_STRVU|nr:unnamed protein product [Strongylus vulgaris]
MAFETNYPIPYRSKLTEPFEPGQTLTVKGKTGEDSVRSGMWRMCERSSGGDGGGCQGGGTGIDDIEPLREHGGSAETAAGCPLYTEQQFVAISEPNFTINLHNAAADFSGNDVPLHVSVRFDEGKVR